jgi:hypothetical protein
MSYCESKYIKVKAELKRRYLLEDLALAGNRQGYSLLVFVNGRAIAQPKNPTEVYGWIIKWHELYNHNTENIRIDGLELYKNIHNYDYKVQVTPIFDSNNLDQSFYIYSYISNINCMQNNMIVIHTAISDLHKIMSGLNIEQEWLASQEKSIKVERIAPSVFSGIAQ